MPVKNSPCLKCGAMNHPNRRTCPSCGNPCRRRGRPQGEVVDKSVGVMVNRSEGESVGPQCLTQPLVGCSSSIIDGVGPQHKSVTVVANNDPSYILSNSRSLVRKRGRPSKTNDTKPCPSCGEQNSLLNSLCDHCHQSLVHKRGRPTKTSDDYSTKPCPSCGEQNSLLNSLCDHCHQSLVHKRGRPTKTSDDYSTKPCPSCGEQNSLLNSLCDHCHQSLVKPCKSGKPCPSCGEINDPKLDTCSQCEQPLKRNKGRHSNHERSCPTCGTMKGNSSYICVDCHKSLYELTFDPCIELPMVNLNDDLLANLRLRCAQQREFDTQPLVDGICYNCGKVLLSTTSTAQIPPPNGMGTDSAPASAYLRAVPNCGVHFVVNNDSDTEKWFCCKYCKSHAVPADQHVGDMYTDDHEIKPVSEWCMSKPKPIAAL